MCVEEALLAPLQKLFSMVFKALAPLCSRLFGPPWAYLVAATAGAGARLFQLYVRLGGERLAKGL